MVPANEFGRTRQFPVLWAAADLKGLARLNTTGSVPRILTIVPDSEVHLGANKSSQRYCENRAGTPIALLIFRETRAHRDKANLGDPSPGS
jgi:hypothetical protein